jgi:lyso-ornithine lipid O-acyltransferase
MATQLVKPIGMSRRNAISDWIAQGIRIAGALASLFLFAGLGTLWLILPRHLGKPLSRLAFSILLWGFGIHVRRQGCLPGTGELLVANHVSWTDIPVLGVAVGAGFVAKQDVRHWPGIGKLAERYGCLFVARDRRSTVRAQADALGRILQDRNLILFPEGTTGDGLDILPFRSSLIDPVAGGRGRLIPVTLAYRWAGGRSFDRDAWQMFAWVGDADLVSHAIKLAAAPRIEVDVIIGQPIENSCRKDLAQAARTAVLEGLDRR